MKQKHLHAHPEAKPGEKTSVITLIAITASTVFVALVMMFFGFFLTVMSLADNPQSTAGLHYERTMDVTLVADSCLMDVDFQTTPSSQSCFRDAVLRNEADSHSVSFPDRQVQPSARPVRVHAIFPSKSSCNQVSLIQI